MFEDPFTGVRWIANGTPQVTWSFAQMPGDLFRFTNAISEPAYQAVVRKAFATWESVANIDFVEVADSSSVLIRLGGAPIDGPDGTLAQARWRYVGQQIIEAEIQFDWLDSWQPQRSEVGQKNFLSTAIHEIGHTIGLAHVSDLASIMFPYENGVVTPSAADIANIRALYGASLTPRTPDQIVASQPTPVKDGALEVFRFFDARTDTHFYTATAGERDTILLNLPSFQYEGPAFRAPVSDSGTQAVYRFFNTGSGTHFFTASVAERDAVQKSLPYMRYEGEVFKSYADAGANGEHKAVYRFLDTSDGSHFYTASPVERDSVQKTLAQYHFEGVAYYVA